MRMKNEVLFNIVNYKQSTVPTLLNSITRLQKLEISYFRWHPSILHLQTIGIYNFLNDKISDLNGKP